MVRKVKWTARGGASLKSQLEVTANDENYGMELQAA
jgi:hypothetical protein